MLGLSDEFRSPKFDEASLSYAQFIGIPTMSKKSTDTAIPDSQSTNESHSTTSNSPAIAELDSENDEFSNS